MKKLFALLLAVACLFPIPALAATLYSETGNQDIYVGQTFVLDWYLNTDTVSVNTLDLKINFSQENLELIEATPGNSLISLWLKSPTVNNGQIELIGGIPNGVNSSRVPVFRTVFKATTQGTGNIILNADSKALRNDGAGTEDRIKFSNISFNIYPESFAPIKIVSSTHPDQNQWYRENEVKISFDPKSGVDYSYSMSSNVEMIPPDQKMEVAKEFTFSNLTDGVYYFKVNSKTGSSNWTEAGVYRIQIDSTPPEPLTTTIATDNTVFEGQPFLSFSTLDKLSGISHYKVKAGLFGIAKETQSPYRLRKPLVGNDLVVTAFDRAGNIISHTVKWEGYISTRVFTILLILIGLLAIAFNKIIRKQIQSLIHR